jgi:integrase
MMTALDDGIIDRNPCRIRGAGSEPTPERPALTVAQVFDLATKVPERYSVLVLVATFGSLPWSEVAALRRRDVSIRTGAIRVERALVERSSGELVFSAPKSRAGSRTVAMPGPVVELLRAHLKDVGKDPDALVFTGDKGGTATPEQLQPPGEVARERRSCRCSRAPLPRPAAYGQYAGCRVRRIAARPDVADGT